MALTEHYDEQYRQSVVDRRDVRLTGWPSDRYEAAFGAVAGRGGNYLEIGAGEGRVAASVSKQFGNLWLVELSRSRSAQLRDRFAGDGRVRLVEGDFESDAVGIPQGFFDVVMMVALIEHLVDPIGCLRKVHAALKPGGIAVIETPNMAKYSRRLKLLAGWFPSTASRAEGCVRYEGGRVNVFDEGHLHYFTYRSLRRLCVEHAGFRSVESRWYGSLAATRSPALLARLWPEMFSECLVVATK